MLAGLQHIAETAITGFPMFLYEKISGLTVPSNVYPDQGNQYNPFMIIPIHITAYQPSAPATVTSALSLPIVTKKGLSYGGQAVEHGPKTLPKFQIEGFIDTPSQISDTYYISQIIDSSGIRYTWGEVIAMCFEGRADMTPNQGWERKDPLMYRDPWGRYYANPRILDFTGSFVETVPQRTQFSMTLAV